MLCSERKKDKIRNEHNCRNNKTSATIQESNRETIQILLKWYGHVMRREVEHIVGRMLGAEKTGKRRRRPNRWWKDPSKRHDNCGARRG